MTENPYRPTVRTQAELEQVWRHLMEPLGFGGASLWMMRVDPDRLAVPVLMEITDTELAPMTAEELDSFAGLLRDLDQTAPGGSFAFLRSRPGHGIEAADRTCASFLYDAGRLGGVRLEIVHLATDTDLVPLPLDEIGLRPTA